MLAQALVRSRARNEAIDEKEQPSVFCKHFFLKNAD